MKLNSNLWVIYYTESHIFIKEGGMFNNSYLDNNQRKSNLGLVILEKFDPIIQLIPLSVIPLSRPAVVETQSTY